MECHTSKVKLLGLLALACLMVALSYFCTTQPDLVARVAGWAGVGFFSLGFVTIPVLFLRKGPQIVIDAAGIDDRRSNLGPIRWEDIRSLSIGSVHSTRFLCVELVEPEKYLSRLPKWHRSLAPLNGLLGFSAVNINFTGLSPGIDEAWAFIQQHVGRELRTEPA